jgi:hypothetical protein
MQFLPSRRDARVCAIITIRDDGAMKPAHGSVARVNRFRPSGRCAAAIRIQKCKEQDAILALDSGFVAARRPGMTYS